MKLRLSLLPLFFVLVPIQLLPFSESGALSSTHAAYDGSALVLKGQVLLNHSLGKMAAEEASLERQEGGKEFPFSLIHLKKEVLLTLKTNAEIRCESADLDFLTLKGVLSSQEEGRVSYTDSFVKKKGEKTFFQIASRKIELGLSKKEGTEKKTDFDLETLLAKEDVLIDYAHAFTLSADHALYRRLPSQGETPSKVRQGIVTAYPKNSHSYCRLTHFEDQIDAECVDLDLLHSKLSMHHPKGTLISPLLSHQIEGAIRFTCDHLTWDHLANTLTLKGKVRIEEPLFGMMTSNGALQLVQKELQGKRSLQSIRTQGESTLCYKDAPEKNPYKLTCHGPFLLDREKLNATLESPVIDGIVPEGKQIYYEEERLGVYSDRATLEYSQVGSTIQPVSLILGGNVRLFSHDPSKPKRCAVADRLTYSPSTRTFILSANPGKKVLFWDDEQSLRVSAQEVHLTQDPSTLAESVKGIGSVQFAFTGEEQALLQKIFSFYRGTHE